MSRKAGKDCVGHPPEHAIGQTAAKFLNVFGAVKLAYDAAVYVGALIPCMADPVNTH